MSMVFICLTCKMSDTESLFEKEDEVNLQRELIAVVRANRFLYDKTHKLYANLDVKTEAWKQIDESLIQPLEGPIAEKKFYGLRQRFGKERRKVVQSMPRSGAGADQPVYTPTWVLYKDLTFMEDIIKPRKTTSNYKSKTLTNSQVPVLHTSSPFPSTSGGQVTMRSTISPLSSTSAPASPDIPNWNSDLFTGTDDSSTDVSEDPFSSLPATPPPATLAPVVVSRSGSNNAVSQVQRTMSNIGIKRKVPPPDSFAIKKRQEADDVNKFLIEQSKGLTDFATKIGQAIMAPPASPNVPSAMVSNASPGIQPMLSAMEFALGAVPEHVQLECLIGVLQYINDFSKNKTGQAQ